MKSAREGQFRELIAKLLTKVDYTGMDFDEVQKWIKDPQAAASLFVYLINHAMQLHFDNLVCAWHTGQKVVGTDEVVRIIGPTNIQPGDTLIFDMVNKTMKVHRNFAEDGERKGMYFKFKEKILDDKIVIEHLETEHEILEACAMLGCIIDCKMEVDRIGEDNTVRHQLRVKFTYF